MESRKVVLFNAKKEADLLKLANSLPNFSGWVKSQLRKMSQQGGQITIHIEDK